LQALLGEHAPLSPASIVRLKQDWEQEYKAWKERPLQANYLYVWTDGVYPKAGPKGENMAVLFVASYGQKYPKAVKSLNEAGELLFSYFDFPEPHWKSIKSTNVIKSMFAAVKLRTAAARRIRTRESALYIDISSLRSVD